MNFKMTDTVIDVGHKSMVAGSGFALSRCISGVNQLVGLLIGIATLVYLIVKIELAIKELGRKK